MIISRNIPLNVQTFLMHLRRDMIAGLHSDRYRQLLIRETNNRYPGLVEGLADLSRGRTRQGQVRVIADADHIIPRSVWTILVPPVWNLPGPAPATPHLLSNLFWRTVPYNRGAPSRGEALDHPWIVRIKEEAVAGLSPRAASTYIEMFLRTKHDEGVNIDESVSPFRVNEMQSGRDLSEVLAFVQSTRHANPNIGKAALIDLIENRFPHIRIETDRTGHWIEFG